MWLRIEMEAFEQAVATQKTRNRLSAFRILWTLLKRARREPAFIDGVHLSRGSCFVGRKELADETGTSEQTVRTVLQNFIKAQILTTKVTNEGTIVNISIYDTLVVDVKHNQPTNQPTTNQRVTNDQPTTNQRPTTNTIETIETIDNNSNSREFPRPDLLRKLGNQIGYVAPFIPARDLAKWEMVLTASQGDDQLILNALNKYSTLKACQEANGAWPFVFTVILNAIEEQNTTRITLANQNAKRKIQNQKWKEQLKPDYGKEVRL